MINSHIELLGKHVTDKVTGLQGVVTSVSFDITGCIQAVVTPKAVNGDKKAGHWIDVTRLDVSILEAVMEVPDFTLGYVAEGKKGASEKPAIG